MTKKETLLLTIQNIFKNNIYSKILLPYSYEGIIDKNEL
jgi:hypothetical protein